VSPRARYVHQAVTSGASLWRQRIFLETKYKLTVVYMHMTKWLKRPLRRLRDKILNCSDTDLFVYFFSGESRQGLYNPGAKRNIYSKGQVAQCSKCTAISLTVFVFSVIFLSSLSIAFIRPFDFNDVCPKVVNDFIGKCITWKVAWFTIEICVTLATLLTLTTEHRGRWNRPWCK
jgi:hypothetical protein